MSQGNGRTGGRDHPPHRFEDGSNRSPAHRALRPRSGLRVDDRDRADIAERLAAHFAAGRLDVEEYEERLAQSYAARTEGDLAAVLTDLPPVITPADAGRRRRVAMNMVVGWMSLNLFLIAIWALTGPGYFWPVWPLLGTSLATLPTAWMIAQSAPEPVEPPPNFPHR
jgi:hypothetical protein